MCRVSCASCLGQKHEPRAESEIPFGRTWAGRGTGRRDAGQEFQFRYEQIGRAHTQTRNTMLHVQCTINPCSIYGQHSTANTTSIQHGSKSLQDSLSSGIQIGTSLGESSLDACPSEFCAVLRRAGVSSWHGTKDS